MSKQTIDYGIDLGTTNSEIARLDGTNIEVFRNAEGFEYTPSAVWIDKQGRLVTGRVAKEWCEREPENAYFEFKRDMGSRKEYLFARSGRKMKPEELSAEILKSLRADVQRRLGEEISAAVITVPAEFNLAASEATKNAAQLAGFQHCALLTEPVAAAQAYSFDRADDKTFWLVYDFGGGTFDTSIIQIRDGLIQVVGGGGDDKLGGKNIDWAIVEQLFIPALTKERALTNFGRGNTKWRGAMAKLKINAEIAKIQLSTMESVEVQIDFLCNDDHGEPVEFNYVFQRTELEKLTAPFIRHTVNIAAGANVALKLNSGIGIDMLANNSTPEIRNAIRSALDELTANMFSKTMQLSGRITLFIGFELTSLHIELAENGSGRSSFGIPGTRVNGLIGKVIKIDYSEAKATISKHEIDVIANCCVEIEKRFVELIMASDWNPQNENFRLTKLLPIVVNGLEPWTKAHLTYQEMSISWTLG